MNPFISMNEATKYAGNFEDNASLENYHKDFKGSKTI